MGDFVAEMIFPVPDEAYVDLAQVGGMEAFGELVMMVEDASAAREFVSTSFDHYVFLGPLIQAYAADDLRALLQHDERFGMTTHYHANSALRGLAIAARALSAEIGRRPDRLIGVVQRSLAELVAAQGNMVEPVGTPDWLRAKRAESHAAQQAALAGFSLSPADVTELLAAAVPTGFVSGDFPAVVTILGAQVTPKTNLMKSVFQSLCYLNCISLHHDEVAPQGHGLIHLLPS